MAESTQTTIRHQALMTLSELIGAFRTEADDATLPYLWSDEEIVGYLNDAESEACIRAGLLVDETSPRVARLSVAAGTAWTPLSSLVLQVDRAWLESPLEGRPRISLERIECPFGEDAQRGTPRGYTISGSKLRLSPSPSEVIVLVLRVSRLPLAPLSARNMRAEPEIPQSEHSRLLDWALYRAFSKRDSDTFDAARALDYGGRFDAHFGPRPSAHARRQYREARRHQVAFNPF